MRVREAGYFYNYTHYIKDCVNYLFYFAITVYKFLDEEIFSRWILI